MRLTTLFTGRSFGLVALMGTMALAGCQADRDSFEAGATLETPPQVEQAPAMPMPAPGAQRGQPVQPEPGMRDPMTAPQMGDTARWDTLGAGAAPGTPR